jgi:acetyl/propionyl-CoA carboxylase alpha subunit
MPVTLYYDPMLAKLIVWAETRYDAITAMLAALREYHVAGICTTIPFCIHVLESAPFREGHFSTSYVREHWSNVEQSLPDELLQLAVAAAVRADARIRARYEI